MASMKTVFTRTGKPVSITIGETRLQIPGGYSEMDAVIVEKIMATPQSSMVVVLSDADATARKDEMKKSEEAKQEAERIAKKLEADNLKKMQEALKLHDIKVANSRKELQIKNLKEDMASMKEAIKSWEKEIKAKEIELAELTKAIEIIDEIKEEIEEAKEVKKSKKGGK